MSASDFQANNLSIIGGGGYQMVFVVLQCGGWLIVCVFVNVMLLWNHSPSAGTECSCSSRTSPPTSPES